MREEVRSMNVNVKCGVRQPAGGGSREGDCFLSEREYTPGSRLPLRESGSGLPQSKKES